MKRTHTTTRRIKVKLVTCVIGMLELSPLNNLLEPIYSLLSMRSDLPYNV